MDEDLGKRIRTEQIKQLYTLIPVTTIGTVINSMILTFVLWNHIAHPVLIGWLSGIACLALYRYLLYFLFKRTEAVHARASSWEHWHTASILLSGSVWGLAGALFLPIDSVVHQVFVAFVVGGMVAGAAAALSVMKRTFFAFTVPALLPIAIRFFVIGGDTHVAMGAMSLLFGTLMTGTALRFHRTAVSSFALRFEKQGLVEKLTEEIGIREQAEAELQKGRDALEATVQERTADLARANRELAQEIAERRSAEAALRDSEGKMSAMLESISEPMSMMDRDLNIIWTNANAVKLLGEDIVGRKCWEVFHGSEAPCAANLCLTHKAFEDGKVHERDTQVLDKDGRIRHFHCIANVALRDDEGKPTAVLEVLIDTTERVRAEEERLELVAQVQHAQKLESLGVLAGGIAHDFNNLLTSVMGNASLALRELSPVSPARHKVHQIELAAQRAADLTTQMLAYSGKGSFVLVAVNLNQLVEEMSHLLQAAISKNTSLKHDFAGNLPAIEADAAQIQQVIMNLITNASDALGDNAGLVTLSTGLTQVDHTYLADARLSNELLEGLYVHVEVSDTGVGMDEETRDRIFDPFFTTKVTGRGLGLAAVLGIVRGHGGAIRVHSEPGRGTTIRVLFPASERKAEAPVADQAISEAWQGSGTVLVVDDEEGVRAVVSSMLEALGFTVMTACDGQEGLDLFREHVAEISAVLLDMTMPRMDGPSAFAEMHRLNPDLPVILMSGYSEQEATSRFAGKGLSGFIQKPFRPADVRKRLRQVLEA